MSKPSFLPTSVSEFIDFLEGETVPAYGDSKETLDALSSFLYNSLRQQYTEFLSIQMKSLQQRKRVGPYKTWISSTFSLKFFLLIFDIVHPGPLRDCSIN